MLVAGAFGTLVGGRIVDRIGRRAVLVGSIVAQIPLLLAFMLAPSELVAGVLLAAIGFVTVMSFSVSVVMGQEYLPSRLGIASGVTLGLAIGMGGVAAAILGPIADHAGLETVMWAIALLPLARAWRSRYAAADLVRALTARPARRPCVRTEFRDATHPNVHRGPTRSPRPGRGRPPGHRGDPHDRGRRAPAAADRRTARLRDHAGRAGARDLRDQPAEWMYNPIGSVHGGVAATLLDSSLGCAIHTDLAAGAALHDDRPARPLRAGDDAPTRAGCWPTARVVHAGRKLATAEGRLYAEDGGKLFAHATTTCLIL